MEPHSVHRLATGDDPIIGKLTTPSRHVLDILTGRGTRRGDNTERLDRMENYRIHQASHRAGPAPRSQNPVDRLVADICLDLREPC